MTEEEAKTLICPKTLSRPFGEESHCLGSACMMFRRQPVKTIETPLGRLPSDLGYEGEWAQIPRGNSTGLRWAMVGSDGCYCGLAGKP